MVTADRLQPTPDHMPHATYYRDQPAAIAVALRNPWGSKGIRGSQAHGTGNRRAAVQHCTTHPFSTLVLRFDRFPLSPMVNFVQTSLPPDFRTETENRGSSTCDEELRFHSNRLSQLAESNKFCLQNCLPAELWKSGRNRG